MQARRTVAVAGVALLAAGAAVGGYFGGREARRADPSPVPSVSTPAVLTQVTASPVPARATTAAAPSRAGVTAALKAALADRRLGGRVLVRIADATSGTVLLDRGGATPGPPASTVKIATAAALLSVYDPDHRLATTVVAGAVPGTVVLVGAGDPTLSAAAAGVAPRYADAGRVSELATAIRRSGTRVRAVVVDTSLFTGPSVSPRWDPTDVPSTFASPITAAMVDGGRDAPQDRVRSVTPDLAAGRALAAALGLAPSAAVTRGRAPAGALVLATVRSAPLATLIAQMLGDSDNVIAECLARQVALARSQPASFAGASTAIRTVLQTQGIAIGAGLSDASGLAASDRLSPAALAALLRVVIRVPRLRPLIDGLPIAGWAGTLQDRYLAGSAGAGTVRAKTGTLTSVSALAGFVHDRDGRLLVFALIADRVGPSAADTDAAERALDTVANALAGCGCR